MQIPTPRSLLGLVSSESMAAGTGHVHRRPRARRARGATQLWSCRFRQASERAQARPHALR
eukprot:15439274-Alexandrium_andersonii.AAC.1